MRRHLGLATALILLLAVLAAPSAYAQAGDGDRFIFNENFVLAEGETLYGGLVVAGGAAVLEDGSLVQQDVAAFGSALTIAGVVRGSVAVFSGSVHLAESAIIEGDFATFGAQVTREPGAVVRGDSVGRVRTPETPEAPPAPPEPAKRSLASRVIAWQFGTLGWALLLVLLGLAAVLLAPRAVGRVASAAAAEPALTFGLGLLTFIVAAMGGTLLLIACGLGLLVWLALGAALLLGWIAVGLWLGQRLLATLRVRPVSVLAQVGLGVALLTVVARLPWCVGFLFTVIAGSIGLGAVIVTRFGTQPADTPAGPAQSLSAPEEPLALAPATPPQDGPPVG